MRENYIKLLIIGTLFHSPLFAQNITEPEAVDITDSITVINKEIKNAGTSTDSGCAQCVVLNTQSGESALQKAVSNFTPEQFKKEAIAASKNPNTVEIVADNFSQAFKNARSRGLLFFKYKGAVYGSLNIVEKAQIESRSVAEKSIPENNNISKNNDSFNPIKVAEIKTLIQKDSINYIENIKLKIGDYNARSYDLLKKITYSPYDVNSREFSKNKTVRSLYETPYGRWLKERLEYNIKNGVNIIPIPPSISLIIPRETWVKLSVQQKANYFDRASGLGIVKIMRDLSELKSFPKNSYLKTELYKHIDKYYGPEVRASVVKRLDL